jgi:hypothetical protein
MEHAISISIAAETVAAFRETIVEILECDACDDNKNTALEALGRSLSMGHINIESCEFYSGVEYEEEEE